MNEDNTIPPHVKSPLQDIRHLHLLGLLCAEPLGLSSVALVQLARGGFPPDMIGPLLHELERLGYIFPSQDKEGSQIYLPTEKAREVIDATVVDARFLQNLYKGRSAEEIARVEEKMDGIVADIEGKWKKRTNIQ